jgi:hypothetical protein
VHRSNADLGLRAARKIVEANDDDWPLYVDWLRRNKELSAVTQQLNSCWKIQSIANWLLMHSSASVCGTNSWRAEN